MTASVRISGPTSLLAAVPYLLGFQPFDSLVLIGLRNKQVTVTARVDLDQLSEPRQLADLMAVLPTKAESTDVMAVTYGERTEADTIAATATATATAAAAATGMHLLEHLRVSEAPVLVAELPDRGLLPGRRR